MALKRKDLQPETLAIYDIVDILAVSGAEQVSAEILFRLILDNQPTLDPDILRHKLAQALTAQRTHPKEGLGKPIKNIPSLGTSGAFNEGRHTKYRLSPEISDSVSRLIHNLQAISSRDPAVINHWAERALEIVSNKDSVRSLVAKAEARKNQTLGDDEFIKLVEQSVTTAPLTVGALAKALRKQGVHMTDKGTDSKVRRLERAGRITTERLPRNNKTTSLAKYVTGITPPEL